jgi:hypothetical protein
LVARVQRVQRNKKREHRRSGGLLKGGESGGSDNNMSQHFKSRVERSAKPLVRADDGSKRLRGSTQRRKKACMCYEKGRSLPYSRGLARSPTAVIVKFPPTRAARLCANHGVFEPMNAAAGVFDLSQPILRQRAGDAASQQSRSAAPTSRACVRGSPTLSPLY